MSTHSARQHAKYVELRGQLRFGTLIKYARVLSNVSKSFHGDYPTLDVNFLPISYRARKELKHELKLRLNWQYYLEKEGYTNDTKIDELYDMVTSDHRQNELNDAMYHEIDTQYRLIQQNGNHSRRDIQNIAKQIRRNANFGFTLDLNNTLDDIRKNGRNYKNVSLPVTVAIDKDFATYNQQQFIREFAEKFNIPPDHIEIKSVHEGSTIIDMKIHTKARKKHGDFYSIECIAENISTKEALAAFTEFKTFFIEFGAVNPEFIALRQRVIMNPQWNQKYGPDDNHWDGPLKDGKSRGGEPYYCPNGWMKFSIQFEETPYDFNNIYDEWPIAYHGTKFDYSLMITLTGLRSTYGDHGTGVYLSPSIEYCAHPRYATPIKLDLSKREQEWTREHEDLLKKYDGKWIQVVFACRVKPGFIKGHETMYEKPKPSVAMDPNFDNDEIEWLVKTEKSGEIVGADRILIYGIMIRASDEYPLSLPTSHYWQYIKWYDYDEDICRYS